MALFNWSAQYETGIFMVDTQHKKLVDAFNTLHDSMKDGKGKEVAEKTLNFLVDYTCLLYTSPSPRDRTRSRMPSSA